MKRVQLLAALLICCCLVSPLWAITPDEGEDGRDWGSSQWIGMPPTLYSVQEKVGDVLVIVQFKNGDGDSETAMKNLQKLFAEHGGMGLWIFAFERNRAQRDAIETSMQELGVGFYVSAGGGERYRADDLPAAWVIGVDGKIAFAGSATDGKLESTIKSELKKIKYPGLGLPEVHREAEKAAKEFVKGDFADALKEARKVSEDEGANIDARDHARVIEARIQELLAERQMKAQDAQSNGNLEAAKEHYEWIIEKFGKRSDEGKAAADAIKNLDNPSSGGGTDNDPADPREAEAQAAAGEILKQAQADPNFDVRGAVGNFLKEYDGTKAADEMRQRMQAAGIDVGGGEDESKHGGATPEEACERVLNAWKKHDVEDLTWCTRPGPMREGVKRDPNFIVTCLNVRRYRVGKVWIKDDNAWVEYSWTCRFDDNKFYKNMMDNLPPNAPRDQADQMAKQRTKEMKDLIEKREHIMGLIKVGDRWYANNQPFYDQEPQFPPTRGR